MAAKESPGPAATDVAPPLPDVAPLRRTASSGRTTRRWGAPRSSSSSPSAGHVMSWMSPKLHRPGSGLKPAAAPTRSHVPLDYRRSTLVVGLSEQDLHRVPPVDFSSASGEHLEQLGGPAHCRAASLGGGATSGEGHPGAVPDGSGAAQDSHGTREGDCQDGNPLAPSALPRPSTGDAAARASQARDQERSRWSPGFRWRRQEAPIARATTTSSSSSSSSSSVAASSENGEKRAPSAGGRGSLSVSLSVSVSRRRMSAAASFKHNAVQKDFSTGQMPRSSSSNSSAASIVSSATSSLTRGTGSFSASSREGQEPRRGGEGGVPAPDKLPERRASPSFRPVLPSRLISQARDSLARLSSPQRWLSSTRSQNKAADCMVSPAGPGSTAEPARVSLGAAATGSLNEAQTLAVSLAAAQAGGMQTHVLAEPSEGQVSGSSMGLEDRPAGAAPDATSTATDEHSRARDLGRAVQVSPPTKQEQATAGSRRPSQAGPRIHAETGSGSAAHSSAHSAAARGQLHVLRTAGIGRSLTSSAGQALVGRPIWKPAGKHVGTEASKKEPQRGRTGSAAGSKHSVSLLEGANASRAGRSSLGPATAAAAAMAGATAGAAGAAASRGALDDMPSRGGFKRSSSSTSSGPSAPSRTVSLSDAGKSTGSRGGVPGLRGVTAARARKAEDGAQERQGGPRGPTQRTPVGPVGGPRSSRGPTEGKTPVKGPAGGVAPRKGGDKVQKKSVQKSVGVTVSESPGNGKEALLQQVTGEQVEDQGVGNVLSGDECSREGAHKASTSEQQVQQSEAQVGNLEEAGLGGEEPVRHCAPVGGAADLGSSREQGLAGKRDVEEGSAHQDQEHDAETEAEGLQDPNEDTEVGESVTGAPCTLLTVAVNAGSVEPGQPQNAAGVYEGKDKAGIKEEAGLLVTSQGHCEEGTEPGGDGKAMVLVKVHDGQGHSDQVSGREVVEAGDGGRGDTDKRLPGEPKAEGGLVVKPVVETVLERGGLESINLREEGIWEDEDDEEEEEEEEDEEEEEEEEEDEEKQAEEEEEERGNRLEHGESDAEDAEPLQRSQLGVAGLSSGAPTHSGVYSLEPEVWEKDDKHGLSHCVGPAAGHAVADEGQEQEQEYPGSARESQGNLLTEQASGRKPEASRVQVSDSAEVQQNTSHQTGPLGRLGSQGVQPSVAAVALKKLAATGVAASLVDANQGASSSLGLVLGGAHEAATLKALSADFTGPVVPDRGAGDGGSQDPAEHVKSTMEPGLEMETGHSGLVRDGEPLCGPLLQAPSESSVGGVLGEGGTRSHAGSLVAGIAYMEGPGIEGPAAGGFAGAPAETPAVLGAASALGTAEALLPALQSQAAEAADVGASEKGEQESTQSLAAVPRMSMPLDQGVAGTASEEDKRHGPCEDPSLSVALRSATQEDADGAAQDHGSEELKARGTSDSEETLDLAAGAAPRGSRGSEAPASKASRALGDGQSEAGSTGNKGSEREGKDQMEALTLETAQGEAQAARDQVEQCSEDTPALRAELQQGKGQSELLSAYREHMHLSQQRWRMAARRVRQMLRSAKSPASAELASTAERTEGEEQKEVQGVLSPQQEQGRDSEEEEHQLEPLAQNDSLFSLCADEELVLESSGSTALVGVASSSSEMADTPARDGVEGGLAVGGVEDSLEVSGMVLGLPQGEGGNGDSELAQALPELVDLESPDTCLTESGVEIERSREIQAGGDDATTDSNKDMEQPVPEGNPPNQEEATTVDDPEILSSRVKEPEELSASAIDDASDEDSPGFTPQSPLHDLPSPLGARTVKPQVPKQPSMVPRSVSEGEIDQVVTASSPSSDHRGELEGKSNGDEVEPLRRKRRPGGIGRLPMRAAIRSKSFSPSSWRQGRAEGFGTPPGGKRGRREHPSSSPLSLGAAGPHGSGSKGQLPGSKAARLVPSDDVHSGRAPQGDLSGWVAKQHLKTFRPGAAMQGHHGYSLFPIPDAPNDEDGGAMGPGKVRPSEVVQPEPLVGIQQEPFVDKVDFSEPQKRLSWSAFRGFISPKRPIPRKSTL